MSTTFNLGPLPRSDETLVAAVWRNFRTAQQFVDEHPGCDIEEHASSLRSVLRIFNGAAKSFFERLERFHAQAHGGELFRRNRRADLQEFEVGFQENLYVFASCAMTLVDQSRALSKKIQLPGYEHHINAVFAENPRHRFVQELRNDLIHVTLHQPSWQITTNRDSGSISRFMLLPEQLSRSSQYNMLARSYVRDHPDGIDLGELITTYMNDVCNFQDWLQTALNTTAGAQIADYRRYSKRIKAVSSRSGWNLILTQVLLPAKRDPYEYLDQYLTLDELAEINALPFKSKAQVDRIISLVDEHDACDTALRAIVYEAFGAVDS